MSLKWHHASESQELGLAEVADVCELLSMLKPKHRDALWGLLVVVTGAVAFQVGRRSQGKAAEPKREAKAAAGAEASARRLATQKARLPFVRRGSHEISSWVAFLNCRKASSRTTPRQAMVYLGSAV